jgi:signal transduction histidine kinase
MTVSRARASDGAHRIYDAGRARLARIQVTPDGTLRAAFLAVAAIATDVLQVNRFGIWLATDDGRAMRLQFLHIVGGNANTEGTVLGIDDFPTYFRALEIERTVGFESDVEPGVVELTETYLRPLGIGALLDAAIVRGGRNVGVVCHEHVGGGRLWSRAERDFASAVADTVTRLYEEDARHTAERSLNLYERELMELTRLEGMGRLAAGVAHDLNNILMVISHGLDELDRARLRETDREALGDVLGALERGRTMVHDLLHFGRDRHDRPAVVAVEEIVDALVRMFTTAGGPGFRVLAEHRSAVSRVMLDRSEIERALMNLIVNARDAMGGQGDVHVVIGEEQVSSGSSTPTRHVTIAVRDSGHGMDEETRRRMFEPFFTRKADGTGLGLAIAHQVVTRAGGSFRVSSAPGEGTTITILLPPIE